ncbi:hypothetical protein TgHK011_005159 [Trichoderma gracile]|nr:hypothetical protein TgHK011_005159 [Trichoderma gracile]
MQASALTSDHIAPPPQFPVFERAAGVCRQCKLSKTRCDKVLPSCNRCLSRKAHCVYGRQISTNNSAGGVAPEDKEEALIQSQGDRASCLVGVPLDACYKLVGTISVALLSGVDDVEQDASLLRLLIRSAGLTTASIVQTYTRTVHSWFPVVSDDQLSHFPTTLSFRDCPSLDGLLLLVMALVLQIGLLLSMFEYGHGLCPEYELTVAACGAFCKSHRRLCITGDNDGSEADMEITCRKAVVIMACMVELSTLSRAERASKRSNLGFSRPHNLTNIDGFEDICGSSSNFDVLFHVTAVVREAIQYIIDEKAANFHPEQYSVIESRLRTVCFALIRAAGPNSLAFCDSIALALGFLFELNAFHLSQSQVPVSTADRLAIESSRRMAVDICRSMNDIVPKKGIEGLSLIGLSVTCRAGQLLAEYDVGSCEGGVFTDEDLEALRRVQHEFTQRWQIGASYRNLPL